MFGQTSQPNSSPFGAANNNAAAPAFGGSSSGGLFGSAAKPFGSLFGTPQNNSISPFGGAAQGGLAFGGAEANVNNGTAVKPFTPFSEKDTSGTNYYQNISSMPEYKNFSFEELRLKDYEQNRRFGSGAPQANAFGASPANNTSFGFGGNTANNNSNLGGASAFGQTNNSAFGQSSNSAFGAAGGAFGQNNSTGGAFGQNNANNNLSAFGSGFGSTANNSTGFGSTGAFGSSGNSAFGANKPAGFGSAFGSTTNNNTSAFGANNNNTSTGFGSAFGSNNNATSSPFGQNNNTTNAFGTNNNNNSSPFGAPKPNGGGLFGGASNNNNAFGASNTNAFGSNNNNNNTGGGLFGSSGSTFGAKPANTAGGLFGSGNNTQNSTFGSSNSGGLFGLNNNTTNTNNASSGFGGLGQNNNTTGGLFGNNSANQSSTGGGLFGSNNQASTTGGGLFGAKPPATGGGLFGANNNAGSGLAGNLGATSGGLFGSKPAAPSGGGLFGNNTQTGGGGLFGLNTNTNSNTSGGLFGGNSNNATTGGTSGGLFGNNLSSGTGGGLFGNNTSASQTTSQGSTLGGNTGFGGGLFGQSQQNQQQPQNNVMQNTGLNLLQQNPYGDNQLFRSITGQNQSNGVNTNIPIATPVNNLAKKAVSMASVHRVEPLFRGKRAQVRPKPKADGVELALNSEVTKLTPASTKLDNAILGTDIFAPKEDYKRLLIKEAQEPKALITNSPTAAAPKQVTFNVERSEPEKEPLSVKHVPELEVDDDGYWTSPPLSELKKTPMAELRAVKDFTVGRKFYGKITFQKPVDLSSFNLDDICGNIVVFGSKNVVVYPDDDQPKIGEGLNLPAEVTLEGCYPINKQTELAILDPRDEMVKTHIEKLKLIPGMKFKDYVASTGNWTFSFEHV